MLANPTYYGMIKYGEERNTKAVDPVTGKVVKTTVKAGPDEEILFKGKHKGIITKEQFDKAQSLMGKSNQPPIPLDKRIVNPLAGLICCANCGKSIQWWNPKNGNNKIICYTHRSSTYCKKKALPVDVVIDGLVDVLNGYINNYQLKSEKGEEDDRLVKHQEMLETMERELASQERKRKKLFSDYEDGTYTKEEFIERKTFYNESIEKLKDSIQEMERNAPVVIDYKEKIYTLRQMIDCIRDQDLTAKAKNDFLKQYIKKVRYDVIDYGRGKGGKPVLDVELK